MRLNNDCWLLNTPIAHRGLWGNGIIENSLSAYKLASNLNLPIEIDLYLTKDNEIVSFHDDNLKRMTNKDALIYDKTLKELKELSLLNSNEKIPTLKEIFEITEGKSPLLIEIKNQPNGKILIDKLIKELKNYKGEFAIQSFNPLYIKRVKKLAPEFIRGILSSKTPDTKSKLQKFVVKHMPFNFLIKPDFISYDYTGLPLKTKIPVICWTVTDKETYEKIKPLCQNVIFEGFKIEKP